MRTCNKQHEPAARVLWLLLAVVLLWPTGSSAAEEQALPLLQIGTRTYTNVTVTTKAKNYIFIVHAGGMTSIKVADLSDDVRDKLGYAIADRAKANTNGAAGWAKAQVARLEAPQVREMEKKLVGKWSAGKATGPLLLSLVSSRVFLGIAAILVLLYALRSYCYMLICQKTGHPSAVLVWVPVFQFIPLLRAAGMSAGWFVAWILPLLNLVAFVVWAAKIAKARGKSGWVAVLLILPPTNFLAILYLALSNGGSDKEGHEEPEVMSLQPV